MDTALRVNLAIFLAFLYLPTSSRKIMKQTDNITYERVVSLLNLSIDDLMINFTNDEDLIEKIYNDKFHNVISKISFLTSNPSLLSSMVFTQRLLNRNKVENIYLDTYIDVL